MVESPATTARSSSSACYTPAVPNESRARCPARALSHRRLCRRRWNGRGLSRARFAARSRRRDQDAPQNALRGYPIVCGGSSRKPRAAAALNHSNILAVYDIGTHEGTPYIVSELLAGETLRDRLCNGTLPIRKTIEYAIQIAHGLAAAHDRGIVHRDLKPENLFLSADSGIKILDFGLAKLKQPTSADTNAQTVAAPDTLPGVVVGTVGYMAPEQVRGQDTDHRADIFSFGRFSTSCWRASGRFAGIPRPK